MWDIEEQTHTPFCAASHVARPPPVLTGFPADWLLLWTACSAKACQSKYSHGCEDNVLVQTCSLFANTTMDNNRKTNKKVQCTESLFIERQQQGRFNALDVLASPMGLVASLVGCANRSLTSWLLQSTCSVLCGLFSLAVLALSSVAIRSALDTESLFCYG